MLIRRLAPALLCATVSTLALADVACAQAAARSNDVEEMVVTARRRAESLQEVPIAVSSFSGEQLEASGAQDLTAISQSAPNVTLENSRATNSTLTAFIRGIGQQDPVAGFEQGVGIYLDDVYLNRPQAAVLDVYDVERIEVLRGPQGTLYGRNTVGGAVKYVTRRLDASAPTFRAKASYGSYDQREVLLAGSTPLSETVRVGGAVTLLKRDGFGKNITTGEDNYDKDVFAARLSAEWEPTSTFLVRAAMDYTQDDSSPRQGYRLLPSATGQQVLRKHYDTAAGITRLGPLRENTVTAIGGQIAMQWQATEQLTLKSITAYREDHSKSPIDFDSTAARSFDAPVVYDNHQFSQEVQVNFQTERLNVVAGAYYLNANAFDAFDVVFTSATSFTLGDVDTRTWALFGEAEYKLTDTLKLTLGGRYTEDERRSHVVRQTFVGINSPFFGNTTAVNITPPVVVSGQQVVPNFFGKRQDNKFTPRVILAWQPNRDLNLYASYSQGFKGGGFDPRGNFANADVRAGFLPEKVDSYEAGLKATLFDGRATANTAVFFADYKDVQIPGSIVVPGPPVTFVGSTTNAGAAEIKGVEFEGTARLTENLRAQLSVGYIDAKYTKFLVGGVNVANQRDVQNTPDWNGAGSLTYSAPLALFGASGTLSLNGAASYKSKTQQFEIAIPRLDQSSYWLVDASASWTSESGHWRLGVYGRNLTDERYIVSGYNFPGAATDNSVLAFYGNPRTVTASVEYRF
jgi:iron complex outermembrane receptor protein